MSKYIPVEPEKWAEMVKAMAENARLKAEVERLSTLVESNLNASKIAMGKADAVLRERDTLKAEVERLTKLCQATSPDGFIHIRDINAAKEGKPSV